MLFFPSSIICQSIFFLLCYKKSRKHSVLIFQPGGFNFSFKYQQALSPLKCFLQQKQKKKLVDFSPILLSNHTFSLNLRALNLKIAKLIVACLDRMNQSEECTRPALIFTSCFMSFFLKKGGGNLMLCSCKGPILKTQGLASNEEGNCYHPMEILVEQGLDKCR